MAGWLWALMCVEHLFKWLTFSHHQPDLQLGCLSAIRVIIAMSSSCCHIQARMIKKLFLVAFLKSKILKIKNLGNISEDLEKHKAGLQTVIIIRRYTHK